MEHPANLPLDAEFLAAMDWWRDAGVDQLFHDEPTHWLASGLTPAEDADDASHRPVAPPPRKAQPAPPPHPAADRTNWPTDLAAFPAWWLGEAWLDQGRTEGRVAPRGPQGADLMVIVPDPEREDSDTLLSGPMGRMLETIVATLGHEPENVYFASALPRHTPMADWAEIGRMGIGDVLAHHVRLVQPKRLITFGGNIPPLFGNTPPQRPAVLENFQHEGTSIQFLAARDLAALLERPRWKAGLWQTWLEWTGL